MPARANYRVVVLFEDEIREAAKALLRLEQLPKDCTDDEYADAGRAALSACYAALGCEAADESMALMLARKPPVSAGKADG